MKKIKKSRFCPLISVAAFALVLSLMVTYVIPIIVNMQSGTMSCTLTLAFDGIEQGKDSKGHPIDINDMKTDAVLNRALEIADMRDRYTGEELRNLLVIRPKTSADALDKLTAVSETTSDKTTDVIEERAIIGSYSVSISDPGLISKARSQKLLDAVLQAYREHLKEIYLQSISAEPANSLEDLQALDYAEMLNGLQSEADEVVRYAKSFANASPEYVDSETQQSFSDIVSQAQVVRDTDLNSYRGLVNYYMLSRNPAARLQYENRRFERYELQYAKLNTRYDGMSKIVSIYDNNTNYVFQQDSAVLAGQTTENTYYASLLTSVLTVKEAATDVRYEFLKTQKDIQKLEADTASNSEQYQLMAQKVDAGAASVYEKLVEIRKMVAKMADDDYTKNVSDKINISGYQYRLTHLGSLVKNFIGFAALGGLIYFVYFRLNKNRIKRSKKRTGKKA